MTPCVSIHLWMVIGDWAGCVHTMIAVFGFMFAITLLRSTVGSSLEYLPPLRLQDTSAYTSCERSFNSDRFSIILPQKEKPEPFECRFIITSSGQDVCRLKINFRKFSVNSSPGCRDEFIRIAGKRLCGNVIGTQTVPFTDSSTVFLYRANGENPLEIDIEQERCAPLRNDCDLISKEVHTEIQSPNYPETYPTPISCFYKVLPAGNESCGAHVRFLDFNLPDSPGCLKGRLLVNGQAYCGQKTGVVIPVNATEDLLIYFTAGTGEHTGSFKLSVDQLPCAGQYQTLSNTSANQLEFLPPAFPQPNLCCNRVFNAPTFLLASPGFLDLTAPTNMQCVYQIAPSTPRTCRLTFHFTHFWLGQEDVYYNCLNGFLEIDGRRYCGCKDGLTIESYFTGGRKELFFTMQGVHNKGFLIEVKQEECGFSVPHGRSASDPEEVTRRPDTEVEVFSTNSTVEKVRSRFFVPRENLRCFQWGLPHWLDKVRDILRATPCYCPAPPPSLPFPPQNPIFPPQYPTQNPILPPQYPTQNPILPPQYPTQNPILPPQYPTQNPILPPQYPQRPPILPPQYPTQNPIFPPQYPTQNPILPPQYPQRPPILPPQYPTQNPILPPPRPPISPPQYPPFPPAPPISPPQFPPQNPILPPQYPPQRPPIPPQYPPQRPPILPPQYPPQRPPILPPQYPPVNPFPPPQYPPVCPIPNPPLAPTSQPISPKCRIFHQVTGSFQSPGYPWNYPPKQNCCFRIRQLPGYCSVQIVMLDFELSWSPKCWKDYLLLDNRGRYCSNSLQSTASYIPFREHFAAVDFVSDAFFSGRGFRALYQQIPCRAPHVAAKSAPHHPQSRVDFDPQPRPRPEPYPHPTVSTTLRPETTTKFELDVTPVR